MKGKIGVGAAETGNEMVFEDADGAFGTVASVGVRWDELKVNVVVGEKLFEDGGCFVVESL